MGGNRSMQAKALKLKKQKRLFPKSYAADYIPTGMPPDRQVMREYKERTRGLAFDDAYMAHLEAKAKFKGVPAGRFEVMNRLKFIECELGELKFVTIHEDFGCKAQLFYNSERTAFMIMEVNYTDEVIRTSIRYMDRDRCILRWKDKDIRWISIVSTNPMKQQV